MTNEEKILVEKYLGYKNVADEAKKNADGVIKELAALAPHKVGEIVKWTEHRRKNVGSWLHPNYVELPPVEKRAVVTKVVADIWKWKDTDATLTYEYKFRLIKKDGGVSTNLCHPNYDSIDAIEWMGEIHEDFKTE